MSKASIVMSFLSVLLLAGSVGASPQEELFVQANDYYKNRQYDSAILAYQQVVDEGVESAPLYFNLGNAYFRAGDVGHAILYYLKAKQLNPTDNDIQANLDYARRYTTIQMEGVKLNPVSSFFESLVEPYRLRALAWVSSVFFILLFVFLTLRYGLIMRQGLIRTGVIVSLVLLVVTSLLTTVKYNVEFLTQRAVIVAEEGIVRTGPSEESDKELDTAPGLVVEILDESGDYYNVLFENKRRGWIRKELVAVV
ncbi:tetratricopeptide repeat protein [candidate division GN15 bacterium]|nr:tetratricopeptide repeat protein [candidate division GN15 bacterium]